MKYLRIVASFLCLCASVSSDALLSAENKGDSSNPSSQSSSTFASTSTSSRSNVRGLPADGPARTGSSQDEVFLANEDVDNEFIWNEGGWTENGDSIVAENNTCASIQDCKSCSSTYTCHWCDADNACHARGSVHGCVWGSSCKSKPKPTPKENTTCASHETCSECALSSHFCHWCEHDNACHAVGSRFGCSVGVDCYSNDRCRREKPEKLKTVIVTKMPYWIMGCVLGISAALIGFLSCCYCCAGGVKGAYDDLATMTVAASVAPISIIGGPTFRASEFQTNLEPHAEERDADDEESGRHDNNNNNNNNNNNVGNDGDGGDEQRPVEETAQTPIADGEDAGVTENTQNGEDHNNHNDDDDNNINQPAPSSLPTEIPPTDEAVTDVEPTEEYVSFQDDLSRPLLPSSGQDQNDAFAAATDLYALHDIDPPTHMNRLLKFCGCFYYVSVVLIIIITLTIIYLYPIMPMYNVCNDSVAWSQIMTQLASLHLGASFEILISVKNMNHVNVMLDKGSGVFRYDNVQVGTFTIPPILVGAMSVTDLMIVAKLEPDKYQALQIASDYYQGKLILDSDFKADLRVPNLFNIGLTYAMKDFVVDISKLSDRSLCHCATWDDGKNSTPSFLELN